nr:auxilin-like protein [Tanacetum cinerariifolium]
MVRNVLFDICRRARISAKKAHVNFLTDPSDERFTVRPVDVLVFGWVGGKHACVDLTEVSPLVGLSSWGFTAGQAALKAASCKVTKHEKTCIENQNVFIPFAFDTFGFLASEAVELLIRLHRVMHNNVMTHRSTDVDVFEAVDYFFMHGDMPNGCNSNFIALIPNILDANMVKDFRLISLIGSLYKIIAKILANRLVGVLDDLVNEVHSAFVADRQILDGPFILNE